MITQTIRVNLNQKDLETILAVQSDTLREIAFEFYATDAEDAVQLDPDDFTVKFNVLKPDNNFVMTTFTDGVIKLSDQITAVTGTGYYCILLMQDNEIIYSGNGKIIINDHVIGTENIDSVSEADGYVFPDDFYTKDTPLAVLDDSTTSTTSTWSSEKIAEEIASIPGVDIIDDTVTSTEKTWSSSKISAEVEAAAASEIDDNTTATDSTWSSAKIAEEISEATPVITKEVTGNPIEFTDGADAPLVKCSTTIQGYQSGTGTPSPDNIRPIVAYTEGKISVGGSRNLLDVSKNVASSFTPSISTALTNYKTNGEYAQGYVSSETDILSNANYRSAFIALINGATYTFSGSYSSVLILDSTGNIITRSAAWGNLYTYTATSNNCYAMIGISSQALTEIQVEYGSSAHTYEPYIAPTTHTTTFPSAIYRGSEDVVGGSMSYDMPVIDLGDLTWTKSGNNFNAEISGIKKPSNATSPLNGLCSAYEITPQAYQRPNTISGLNWMDGIVFWGDGTYETAADFTTAVTGVKLAYTLATPIISSVTPTNLPIKSLFGYNHIESSTGEMEIEYLVDDYQPIIDCIPSGPTYSTDEQITGTWTDGRPVYTRIIPVNATWQNIGTTSRQSFVYLQDFAKQIDIITDLFIIGKDQYYGYTFNAAANLDRVNGSIEACWNDPFGGLLTSVPVECVRMSYVKTASVSRNLQRTLEDIVASKIEPEDIIKGVSGDDTSMQDAVKEVLDNLQEEREEDITDEVHDQEMPEPGTYDTYRE